MSIPLRLNLLCLLYHTFFCILCILYILGWGEWGVNDTHKFPLDALRFPLHLEDMRGDSYQLQGQQGGQAYNSADGAVTGDFRWIQCVTDTVFSVIASPNIMNASTKLITITHNAGSGLGGNFTGFTITSGTVIAYRA